MTRFRTFMRSIGMKLVRRFGASLRDAETGEVLGRVLIVPWRGRIHVIGLEEVTVRPAFLPQQRLTYWKQDLGFTRMPPPDFPSEAEQQNRVEIHRSKRKGQPAARDPHVGSYLRASILACL
jgi:hypothetical protein